MRCVYISDLADLDSYVITGDQHHHLAHVVRIEEGETLLLLNGKGLAVKTQVDSVSKKELRARRLATHQSEHAYLFDLVIGMPKREALELCLKQAVELGFRKIYLVKSQYSQMRPVEADRLHQLLVSALEQSNAPFLPEVVYKDWAKIPWGDYEEALMLDSQQEQSQKYDQFDPKKPKLLIIGPEGGFSPEEREFLRTQIRILSLKLPTPILRTPTALAAGAGFLLGELLK